MNIRSYTLPYCSILFDREFIWDNNDKYLCSTHVNAFVLEFDVVLTVRLRSDPAEKIWPNWKIFFLFRRRRRRRRHCLYVKWRTSNIDWMEGGGSQWRNSYLVVSDYHREHESFWNTRFYECWRRIIIFVEYRFYLWICSIIWLIISVIYIDLKTLL